MKLKEFYEAVWAEIARTNPELAGSMGARAYSTSSSYRGTAVPGTRFAALVNFKQEYGNGTINTGHAYRDACVSYYTDHREDPAWRRLLAKLHAEGSPVPDSRMVIEERIGGRDAAQVLFVHQRVAWRDAQSQVPALARWMAESHRRIADFAAPLGEPRR